MLTLGHGVQTAHGRHVLMTRLQTRHSEAPPPVEYFHLPGKYLSIRGHKVGRKFPLMPWRNAGVPRDPASLAKLMREDSGANVFTARNGARHAGALQPCAVCQRPNFTPSKRAAPPPPFHPPGSLRPTTTTRSGKTTLHAIPKWK